MTCFVDLNGTHNTLYVFYRRGILMLTCLYHPIDGVIVVEDHEAERLRNTGVWFDHPNDAKNYRQKVENNIKSEAVKPVEDLSPVEPQDITASDKDEDVAPKKRAYKKRDPKPVESLEPIEAVETTAESAQVPDEQPTQDKE